MSRFAGQVALVTGAGSGIGRATALRLAGEGARVLVVGRTPATIDETVALIGESGGTAQSLRLDVAAPGAAQTAVDAALAAFGRLDVLVNNAALGRSLEQTRPGIMRPLTETSEALFREVVEVDLNAAAFFCRAALPAMVAAGGGAIVNVSSLLGLRGSETDHAYSAAKGGLINLTRSIAITYGPQNVRANCVAPGLVDTEMAADIVAAVSTPKARFRASPLGRPGQPAELAAAIAFLASGDASFVNGQCLVVDGGLSARVS